MYYSEKGILVQNLNYKEGLYNGFAKLYHDNGKLHLEGNFKNGLKKDGVWKTYDENGQFLKMKTQKIRRYLLAIFHIQLKMRTQL